MNCAQQETVRVMIVEDYLEVAETFKFYLEFSGFEVAIERNPLEVLKRAETEHFPAYLIDIGLDTINGLELARRLRKIPFSTRSFLIAVTGLGDVYRGICLAAGFNEFFAKPVDASSIVTALKDRFKQR